MLNIILMGIKKAPFANAKGALYFKQLNAIMRILVSVR
jgi:hypothetical protein